MSELSDRNSFTEDPSPSSRSLWDLVSLVFALAVAGIVMGLGETNAAAEWLARHKDSKLDEAIFVGVLFVVGLIFFFFRKSHAVNLALLEKRGRKPDPLLPESERIKKSLRRDLSFIVIGIAASAIAVSMFDTGNVAEWIGNHRDTKIDEALVAGALLLVGVAFFSLRRWFELSQQLLRYESLYSKTTELNRQSALLSELSDLLQSSLTLTEVHQLITERAQLLFPETSGAVCITVGERQMLEVASTWGKGGSIQDPFSLEDCWALRRGRIHIFAEHAGVLNCPHVVKDMPAPAMCVPMLAHGEILGLLYVRDERQGSSAGAPFSEAQQRLAKTIAEHAALAVANLKMREELKAQSIKDPLTGLYNRRYMLEVFQKELTRAERKSLPLGAIMLDVDHFKRLNDSFGHDAGDTVLRVLSQLLGSLLRASDVVCRYGGEEFVVIIPEAPLHIVQKKAELIRERIKGTNFEHAGGVLPAVTLSIGVASFPENGRTPEDLIQAADSALYRAKNQGRDQIVVAGKSAAAARV